ncbi:MAG TPA: ACT domain-containing protein, partial [Microthrixaceae bacterium]|nr:ACT domain-containing protein [Microthrixaceae bacterium]
MAATAVLLLSCPDRTGVVAAVADFVWRHGGNIVDAEQHTDDVDGVFFQRVEFELDGFAFERDDLPKAFWAVAERFDMDVRVHFSDERPRLAIL